jgi:predicted dehydrogenase
MKTRRSFLGHGILAATCLYSSTAISSAAVAGANDKIRIGFIGLGGRGMLLLKQFAAIKDVEVAYLCDADSAHLDKAKSQFPKAKTAQDMRKIFDDPDIDAVVIGTCSHWHALATVWACQAGKDVYVEKPVSHNIWEGRKMVEAATKYERVVQGGTQQRSDPFQQELKAYLDSGELGKIRYVRCNHYGKRESIGKIEQPLKPPASVDYNLWLGPALDEPIHRKNLHYDWHWVWNTGNGEMGNWGVHILDDLRNVVFRDKISLPKRVISGGGRFGWNDAGQTPNTQFYYMDTGDIPVVLDVHNLPRKKGMNAGDIYLRRRTSSFLIIECENGYYAGARGGGAAHDSNGKIMKRFSGNAGAGHQQNFIDAVRSRKSGDLAAGIEQSHYSSAWCHLANVSWRLGKDADIEAAKAELKDFEPWQEILAELPAHLDANEIQLKSGDLRVGKMLEIDVANETIIGDAATAAALALIKPEYRKGFEVPDKV